MVRIGEAAQAAGMTSKALRFYEEHGLLPAAKRTANGYRDYHGRNLLTSQLADLDAQIAGLVALRATVAQYHAVAAAADPDACDAKRICSYL